MRTAKEFDNAFILPKTGNIVTDRLGTKYIVDSVGMRYLHVTNLATKEKFYLHKLDTTVVKG